MEWKPFIIASLAVAFVVSLLWALNMRKEQRYRQWWSPVAAFCICALSLWVFLNPYAFISSLIQSAVVWSQSLAAPYIADPSWHFPLYFNVAILLLALLVKAILKLQSILSSAAARAWSRIGKKSLPAPRLSPVSIAYSFDTGRNGISLRSGWVFPASTLRWISGFAALAFLASLGAAFSPLPLDPPIDPPLLPAIPLLLFLEMAWYLGGPRPPRQEGDLSTKPVKADLEGNCFGLWTTYTDNWKDRILSASPEMKIEAARQDDEPFMPEDPEIAATLAQLAAQGFRLSAKQRQVLADLLQNADVLVESDIYEEVAPMLFASLQRDILNGRRVIVLTGQRKLPKSREGVFQWLNDWLSKPLYASLACGITDLEGFHRTEDVLVASVRELLDFDLMNAGEWLKELKTVVVLHTSQVVFPDMLSATSLFRVLDDLTNNELQIVMLDTDNRPNLESSLRECLTSMPREHRLQRDFPQSTCFIIWKSEGDELFQDGLIESRTYLGAEPVLGIPAVREGISEVHLAGLNREPWRECIEELNMRERTLVSGQTVWDVFKVHDLPYTKATDARAFVIFRDEAFNPAATLVKGLALIRESGFVQVVSPPFLLRDYIVDNLLFFIEEPLGALAPAPMKAQAVVASYLLQRLLRTELAEGEIREHIGRVSHELEIPAESSVEALMAELFESSFGNGQAVETYLRSRMAYRYDLDLNVFEEVAFFRFDRGMNKEIGFQNGGFYRIKGDAGEVLDILPREHIHQEYLPHQVHSFQGESFAIESVNDQTGIVSVSHLTQQAGFIYRPVYSIAWKPDAPVHSRGAQEVRTGEYTLQSGLYETSFSIETRGYYFFQKGIDFSKHGLQFRPLSAVQVPARNYAKGRMLRLSLSKESGAIEHAARISFTMALLLNEIFPTVFPETHRYAMASTPFRAACEEECVRLVPPLDGDLADRSASAATPFEAACAAGTEPGVVTLYAFEDSQTDMGLVKATFTGLDHLLSILEDYLTWLLDGNGSTPLFLAYGESKVSDALALEPTRALLSELLAPSINTLRRRREQFQKGEKVKIGSINERGRRCDFCAEVISETLFERLEDGRERCARCKSQAVDTEEELRRVYDQARQTMKTLFGVSLRENLRVRFTDAHEVHEAAGGNFIPTSKFDPRTIGVAVKEGNDYSIHIENGQPRHMVVATLVHELTHIWQFDHLDFLRMKSEYGHMLTEGHAVWASIQCLKALRMGEKYSEREAARDDDYGKGCRMIEQMVQASGGRSAFELLSGNYPKG